MGARRAHHVALSTAVDPERGAALRGFVASARAEPALKPQVIAYTDGGCRGNPGLGAWGFLLVDPDTGKALERTGGEKLTTNNRMELMAVIEALRALKAPDQRLSIYSDSTYVIHSATKWMSGWKAKGWKRKDGELKNVDLLKELDRLLNHHQIEWHWVKGHDGDPGNERADALTNEGMDRIARGEDPAWERRTTWNAAKR